MKRTWTIIGVADVPESFKWYQSLLGLPETAPAHDDFGQIVDLDGTVLLCLHKWGAHEHPSLTSPAHATPRFSLARPPARSEERRSGRFQSIPLRGRACGSGAQASASFRMVETL